MNHSTKLYHWGNISHSKLATVPTSLNVPFKSQPHTVYAGTHQSSIITNDRTCYVWMNNGTTKFQKLPRKIKSVAYSGRGGGRYGGIVVVIDDDNRLWEWNDTTTIIGEKVKLKPFQIILGGSHGKQQPKSQSVCCGEWHTVIVLDKGLLSLGDGIKPKRILYNRLNNIFIKEVACGVHHTVALSSSSPTSEENRVYTWGWGEYGRLGHGDEDVRYTPVELTLGVSTKRVACGSAHTLLLTTKGDVWSFGWNLYGQVGVVEKEDVSSSLSDRILVPKICLEGRNIEMMSGGFGHSAAVSENGVLYVWGFNEEGQLGLGHEDNIRWPTRVDLRDEDYRYVVSVACGHTHTICVASKVCKSENEQQRRRYEARVREVKRVLGRFARKVLLHARLKMFKSLEKEVSSLMDDDTTSGRDSVGGEEDWDATSEKEEEERREEEENEMEEKESNVKAEENHDEVPMKNTDNEDITQQHQLFDKENEKLRMQNEINDMKIEDEHSARYRRFLINEAAKRQSELQRVRSELNKMRMEDEYAKAHRKLAQEEAAEEAAAAAVRRKEKREEAARRNARRLEKMRMQMKKEAERLKKAREQTKEIRERGIVLPNVVGTKRRRRRRHRESQSGGSKHVHQSNPTSETDRQSTVLPALTKRDEAKHRLFLLRNRKKRLEERKRMQQEETETLQRETEARRTLEQQMNYQQVMKWKRDEMIRERQLKERQSKTLREMIQLGEEMDRDKENMRGDDPIVVQEGSQTFMSASQWGRKLSKSYPFDVNGDRTNASGCLYPIQAPK